MSNFKLKHPFGIYKVAPHKKDYISNKNITDELAVEFLKHNPEKRIELFSKYPENWKEMVEDDFVFPDDLPTEPEGDNLPEPISEPEEAKEDCSPCAKRKELRKTKMSELREMYPEVTMDFGSKKEEYIDKIIQHLYPKDSE